jgi:hypothetical protein
VACPFFVPTTPLGREHWLHAPRFPLGDAHRGVCRAAAEPFLPPESSLEDLCNCGYARGRCDRFRPEGADAVRFSLAFEDDARIRVVYVLERNHAPQEHGVVEYLKSSGKMETQLDAILLAQATAFIESHLRRAENSNSRRSASARPAAIRL